MVCMIGRWRMSSVVKLLKAEHYSDATTEEMNDEKISTQIINKGFLDADEANLLEEEDMHVFGCKPMADPLHLVSCNSCKKPVRASQYSAHAVRCGPLTFERCSPSGSNKEVKAKKPPPRKGKKASELTANGNQNASISTKAEKEKANKIRVSGLATDVEDNLFSAIAQGVPHPLATKIYHCQKNSQLRFELSQIYHGVREEGYFGNCSNLASVQENGMVNSHAMAYTNSLHGSEKNGFVQTKSKSFQKEAHLPQAVKGVPDGGCRWDTSVKQVNGSSHD